MRALLATILVVALAAPAAAQNPPEETAKIHFQAGAMHYERGRYAEAIEEFQEAYRLTENAALLYNIAQAYEKLGDLRNARDHLSRYVDSGKADPGEIETLKDKLVSLDERIAAEEAAKPRPARPARPFRVMKWVGLGVTVLAAGAATYFTIDAAAMQADIEDAQNMDPLGEWTAELADKESRGETDVILAWVSGGVAVAAAAATAYFFLRDAKDARAVEAWKLTVVPTVAKDQVGASVLWRF